MVSNEIKMAVEKEKKERIKWGFIWGGICALLWGLGYVPSAAVWKVPDLANTTIFPEGMSGSLLALLVIATGYGVTKVIISILFWAPSEGKTFEVPKAILNFRISKVMLVATAVSLVGVAGYQLAVAYVGASFAAAACLLTGVFASFGSNLMYKEKLSKKMMIGIGMIIVGGFFTFNPYAIMEDITNPATKDAWLGYLGGIAAAVSWGMEGVLVGKASDMYDYSMNMSCRGTFDFLLWAILIVPVATLIFGYDLVAGAFVHIWGNPTYWIWEFLCVLSLYSAYVGMYRTFPLIGAGRGLSLSALYVIPGFFTLYLFMGDVIKWYVLVGALLGVAGTIYMYWESGESLMDGTRAIDSDADSEPAYETAEFPVEA